MSAAIRAARSTKKKPIMIVSIMAALALGGCGTAGSGSASRAAATLIASRVSPAIISATTATLPAPTQTTAAPTPTPGSSGSSGGSPGSSGTSGSGGSTAYSCIYVWPPNNDTCQFSSDPYITGISGEPYVGQNVWSQDKSYQQTLYANSPQDWYVIANADTHFGGVLTFPNAGFNMPDNTINSYSSITSSWNVTIPTDDSIVAGWAGYDLWFNDWNEEVMILTDITANSDYDCTAVATATFGGMPWHLCVFGSERVWKPGTDDQNLLNQTSGTVDVLAMLEWLENNDHPSTTTPYLTPGSTWTAGSFGFEICDTEGNTEKFQVNSFSWDAQ